MEVSSKAPQKEACKVAKLVGANIDIEYLDSPPAKFYPELQDTNLSSQDQIVGDGIVEVSIFSNLLENDWDPDHLDQAPIFVQFHVNNNFQTNLEKNYYAISGTNCTKDIGCSLC